MHLFYVHPQYKYILLYEILYTIEHLLTVDNLI